MTSEEIIISIFIYVLGIAQTSIFPFFSHRLWAQEMDIGILKTIKIKKLRFLFNGYKFSNYFNPNQDNIKNYELPVPIFIEQISAYALTIIYITGMIILGVLISPKYMVVAPMCVGIFSLIYEGALIVVSKVYCKCINKTKN